MLDQLEREAKVLIYVLGVIDELKFRGYVQGGYEEMTDKGREVYLELKESGFQITEQELKEAMAIIQRRV